jgi:hypothetical protein
MRLLRQVARWQIPIPKAAVLPHNLRRMETMAHAASGEGAAGGAVIEIKEAEGNARLDTVRKAAGKGVKLAARIGRKYFDIPLSAGN